MGSTGRAEMPTRCPQRRGGTAPSRAVVQAGCQIPAMPSASGASAPSRRPVGAVTDRQACTTSRSADQLPNHWAPLPLAKALMSSGRARRLSGRLCGGRGTVQPQVGDPPAECCAPVSYRHPQLRGGIRMAPISRTEMKASIERPRSSHDLPAARRCSMSRISPTSAASRF
jgi:hypothetical protein